MKYFSELVLKLFFLFSIFPFLLSEKIQQKFDLRINTQVVDHLFSGSEPVGEIQNKEIDEASGLAASRSHHHILYTHNDSGGEPLIYMIDTLADYRGKIRLNGVHNRDWEDIAVGPGPIEGKNYVYVGDIGDNYSKYDQLFIYRFAEPDILGENLDITPEKITLKYPDGPRDAETLMVDPWNGDVFILTKRDSSNVLYRAKADQLENGKTTVLEKIMKLPVTMSTAGDISLDGTQILIKNYWVVYYWQRDKGQSIPDVLNSDPVLLPYNPEPQGEAIAFLPHGNTYFTLSEKKLRVEPVLYRYNRVKKAK